MAHELIFETKPFKTTISGYRLVRNGFIIALCSAAGTHLGRITVSTSGEQRGALWLLDSLVGEFEYSRKKWRLYPIEQGRIATRALDVDPLLYLIERYERGRDGRTANGYQNGEVAVA
jgi:hypothetical protein